MLEMGGEQNAILLEKKRADEVLATPPPTLTTPRMERDMADRFLTPSATSAKGCQAELIACAWLMGLGYQVFRNVCSVGPADLIVWQPQTGETIFIDVKSLNSGTISQRPNGILAGISIGRPTHDTVHCLLVISGKLAGFYRHDSRQWYWPLGCPQIPCDFSPPIVAYEDEKKSSIARMVV